MNRIDKLDAWLQGLANDEPLKFYALVAAAAGLMFGTIVLLERIIK